MTNYEKTKELVKETKKLYFDIFMMTLKETGTEIDFSDLDDGTVLMLKNSLALLDKAFDLVLSQAKQNDEMSERLINIELKLDAVLARMSQ